MPNINKIINSADKGHRGREKAFLCRRVMPTHRAECRPRCKMCSGPDKHSIPTCQNLSQLSNQWLQVKISELTLQVSYSCVCTGGPEFEARNKPQGFPPPAMF